MNQIKALFFQAVYRNEGDTTFIKRSCKKHAKDIGISDEKIEKMKIAISEALSNVSKYAGGYAEITCYPSYSGTEITGMELKIKDYGSGIENLELALTDQYSTSGSLGLGLGSMKRLVDKFEIISVTEEENFTRRGTTVILGILIDNKKELEKNNSFRNSDLIPAIWGVAGRTHKSKFKTNGDSIYWTEDLNKIFAIIVDSVNNNNSTNDSTISNIISYIKFLFFKEFTFENIAKEIEEFVESKENLNLILIGIDKATKILNYTFVGNIFGYLISGINQILSLQEISKKNNLEAGITNINILKLPKEFILVIHTDGLSENWTNNMNLLTIQSNGQNVLLRELFDHYSDSQKSCSIIVIQNH